MPFGFNGTVPVIDVIKVRKTSGWAIDEQEVDDFLQEQLQIIESSQVPGKFSLFRHVTPLIVRQGVIQAATPQITNSYTK